MRRFTTVKLGVRVMVPESELRAMIERNTVPARAPKEFRL